MGREAEHAAGSRFVDRLFSGPQALVLRGEPGIGKTTVWQAVVDGAHQRETTVWSCRPAESETALSFVSLTDLLAAVPADAFEALPPPQRHALGIALLQRDTGGNALDHRAVGTALVSLVRHRSEQRPVVIAVDDAHWIDPSTARVLEFAIRRLEGARVGFLVSARAGAAAPLVDSLERWLESRTETVTLGPLRVAALHHLLRERLGRVPPRYVLLRIEEISGGNPMFALEIAGSLARSDRWPRPGEPVELPRTLRELVEERIRRLPDATREALLFAAATPRPTLDLVNRAASAPFDIAGARETGVVEVSEDRIVFTHPLLRSALYEMASAEARRAVHAALASAIDDVEERGRHVALAATGPDETVARALDAAAVAAGARGASDAVADLLEEATRLTPTADPGSAWRRKISAAQSRFESGDPRRASELLEDVIGAAPAGVLRADALRRLAMIRLHEDAPLAAQPLFERAIAESANDVLLRGRAELGLTWAVIWSGDVGGGLGHAHRALEYLQGSGDPADVASAVTMAVTARLMADGHVEEAMLEHALALESQTTAIPIVWRPSMFRGYIFKLRDQIDQARDVFQALHRALRDEGDEASLPFLLFQLGELEAWAGSFAAAARYGEEAHDVATRNDQLSLRASGAYTRALAYAHLGRVDEGHRLASEAFDVGLRLGIAPLVHLGPTVLGFIALSVGDAEEADRRLAPLSQLVAAAGLGDPSLFRFLPDHVDALVMLGRAEEARRLLEPFEEAGRRLGRRWVLGAAARGRAACAAASRDLDAATSAAAEAVVHHSQVPLRFDLARSLLVQGQVHRRSREKRLAREALERAVALFEDLGTPLWREKGRSELARIGIRPSAPSDLTATEQRVAELAVRGMTNREIADAAFMSPKTVESALGRVYRKLGIRSRAELGGRLAAVARER